MALRKILNKSDEALSKVCKKVDKFDDKLEQLVKDMIETLHEADGAGLAACQVGILRRVVVCDMCDDEGPYVLINPEIIKMSGEQYGVEGCLSCPGDWGYVRRAQKVKFKAQDIHGEWYEKEVEDLFARCVQHECDHLEGKVFVRLIEERVSPEDTSEK